MSKSTLDKIAAASSFTGISEEVFLGEAETAGVTDRKSGAYDEFHFAEEGIGQTPFESSVDSRMALVKTRLSEAKTIELSKLKSQLEAARSDLAATRLSIIATQERIDILSTKLSDESLVLTGERTGESGLSWATPLPATNTRLGAWLKLITPVFVFAFAALVDLYIIFYTYFNVSGSDINEARMFTIPAVAVQVLFPHFAGGRIGLLVRGHTRRAVLIVQLLLLLASWAIFVWSLQTIRMTWFTIDGTLDSIIDPTVRNLAAMALQWSTIMMLVGLGGWMIFNAMNDNPHVREYLKLWLRLESLESQLLRLSKMETKQLSAIETGQKEVDAATENFDFAIAKLTDDLAVAAKDVYRRSLINSFGDTAFTAAFMNRKKTAPDPAAHAYPGTVQ